ncbi:MAG: RluA family pseudouridine synthase [Actinomycetia bacterium]|nr:RluA family pseudouridine synthase [Actinomycetes bacterium]
MTIHTVVVPEALSGIRADRVIAEILELPRSHVKDIIDSGGVTRNGVAVKPSEKLSAETSVVVEVPDHVVELAPDPDVVFDVLYEDRDIIVVDKQIGLVVHPGSGKAMGTLANGLLARYPEIEGVGQVDRWGIVHRLDRDTSGVMVVARTQLAYDNLVEMMRNRSITRRYLACVAGVFTNTKGTIDAPIGRDPANPTRMGLSRSGRAAVTHYRRLAQWIDRDVTLLSVTLETGRTHQIRVHMRAIGAPIVGDTAYGRRGVVGDPGRPWLHARQLSFAHPTTEDVINIVADLPDDLCHSLDELGVPEVGGRVDIDGENL